MPAQTTHHVGGTKHFECRVKGHPRPEIRWYKDNRDITLLSRYKFDHSQEGVISMVIPDITLHDEGHYRCRAENSEGFASTSAYLFVRVHKEHLEEATTSFHTMQIEESVLFTENEKASKKASKTKVSEPHFETPIEEIRAGYLTKNRNEEYLREMNINGDYSKEKKLSGNELKERGLSEDELKERGLSEDELKEKDRDGDYLKEKDKRGDNLKGNVSGDNLKEKDTSGDDLREKQHIKEKKIIHKSLESVVETSTSSTSKSKQEKENAEQESNKIKADMLEKSYHSSDESNDEVDAVRLRRVSERSETMSGSESQQDLYNAEKSSLLMRQTKRLFSHEYDEDNDLFQIASSTMLDNTVTANTTSISSTVTTFTKTKSSKVEISTSNVKSSSEETRQEMTRSGKLETSKTVMASSSSTTSTSHTTATENDEVVAQPDVSSQAKPAASEVAQHGLSSQAKPAASEVAGTESSTSLMSVSHSAGKAVASVEEASSGSRSSRSMLEQSEVFTSTEEVISRRFTKEESGSETSSFIQNESDLLLSSKSQLLAIKTKSSDSSNNYKLEETQKVTSEVQTKQAPLGHADESEKGITATVNEQKAGRLNNEKLQNMSLKVETEELKFIVGKEEEDNESASESEAGSSAESVVDVDFDLTSIHKLRKQESKEKDEAEEEARLAAAEASRRAAQTKAEEEAKLTAAEASRRAAQTKAEEEAKLTAAEASRRAVQTKAEEEAKLTAAEASRRAAQTEAEEEARIAAAEASRRALKAEAEEEARIAAAEASRWAAQTKAEEEAKLTAAEASRRAAQTEAEEEAKIALAEASRRAAQTEAEEEARIAAAEASRRALKAEVEEEARIAAAEASRRAAQTEAEEEAKIALAEASRRAAQTEAEEEPKVAAAEASRRALKAEAEEEARIAAAEASRKAAQTEAEEEARIAAAEASRRALKAEAEEEARIAAAEASRRAAQTEAEEEARIAAAEASRKAAQTEAEEEARIAAAETSRRALKAEAEEEARIAAAEASRRAAQTEAEEEARIAAAEASKRALKAEAEEEARIAAVEASRKALKAEIDGGDINKKGGIEDEEDDFGDKRKSFRGRKQKEEEDEIKDDEDEKKAGIGAGEKMKVVEVEYDNKNDISDDGKTADKNDDERHAVKKDLSEKDIEVDDEQTFAGRERKGKSDERMIDDDDDKRGRDYDNVDGGGKGGTVNDSRGKGRLAGDDDDDDDEGKTEDATDQRISWINKVEEEKEKAEKEEKDDAMTKEGDRVDEIPNSEPRNVHRMEDVKVNSGKTLKLHTQVQATPRPKVTWSKDGRTLQQGGRVTICTDDDVYSLEIEEVTDGDAGTYRFRAVNSEGQVFTDVVVNVISAVPSSLSPGDRQLSLIATVGIPQFLVQPQDVSVAESETIKLTCTVTGDPAPKVSWQKDGAVVRSNRRVRVYESRGVYNLEIHDCEAGDAGGYLCTATNSQGQVTASINVLIDGISNVMSTSGLAELDGLAAGPVEELLVGATGGGTESSSDELFLKSYVVLMDYTDGDNKTSFVGGEMVEVLDSRQKSGMWLVRGKVEKNKVCFVPSSLLCIAGDVSVEGKQTEDDTDEEEIREKKKERKTNHSPKFGNAEVDIDTSEDELKLRGVHPDYVAVVDYIPPPGDTSSVRLSEGQIVEVVDKERSDLWLVKTRPTKTSPSRQGWVPSAYLEEKNASSQLMSRSTRETFREEVLQVSNKQQEASLKRRYVIKELEETEREYIRDLKLLVDVLVAPITRCPDKVSESVAKNCDIIFSNIVDILQFHDSQFLADITECCINPSSIGSVFLKWKSEFDNYIKFLGDREAASFLLESEDIRAVFKEFSKKSSISENDIKNLLKRPIDRLKIYQLLLRGILRYAARAGEDCSQVQEAIAMLIDIEKVVENSKLLPLLEGFEVDSTDAGNLLRHDDFLVWEGDVSSTRNKDRHVFLFADKIVMTKKKKPELSTDQTYFSYKSSVDLSTVRVRESPGEDDRKFELWFTGDTTLDKVTLQARSGTTRQIWVKDICEALIKLGVSEPDKMPEAAPDQTEDDYTPAGSTPSSPILSPTTSPSEEFGFLSQGKEAPKDRDKGKSLNQVSEGVRPEDTGDDSHVTVTDEDSPSMPFFRDMPTNVVSHEGHPTRIDCPLGGNPIPTVTWQKGDKRVQQGAAIKTCLEGKTASLLFSEVSKRDSGTYTVTLSNSQGSSSFSFDLVVLEDLVETDTSTDRTNGEVEDTESGSETVVEEEEESRLVERKGITKREEEFEFVREVVDEVVSGRKENQERKRERVEETSEEKEILGGRREEESDSGHLVVECQGQVHSFEQASSFSSETSTSRSVLRVEEGEDWAVQVSSQIGETSSHKSENLAVKSQTFIESSVVNGTEVTQSSLSFVTDISSSESAQTFLDLAEPQQSHSKGLLLQSDTSFDSSTYKQSEVSQNLLSFETGISNSESVETVLDLIQEQSQSKGLSLQSDISVDSSTYKQSEVSQNLLSFETGISNSESVETVLGLTALGGIVTQQAEVSTHLKTGENKARVEQVKEAEVLEEEIVADARQVSKVQEKQTAKLTQADEVPAAKAVAKQEKEGQSSQKDKAESSESFDDFKTTETTEQANQERDIRKDSTSNEDLIVRKPEVQSNHKEDSSPETAFESATSVPKLSDVESEITFGEVSKLPTEDTQTEALFQDYLLSGNQTDKQESNTNVEATVKKIPESVKPSEEVQDFQVETVLVSKTADRTEEAAFNQTLETRVGLTETSNLLEKDTRVVPGSQVDALQVSKLDTDLKKESFSFIDADKVSDSQFEVFQGDDDLEYTGPKFGLKKSSSEAENKKELQTSKDTSLNQVLKPLEAATEVKDSQFEVFQGDDDLEYTGPKFGLKKNSSEAENKKELQTSEDTSLNQVLKPLEAATEVNGSQVGSLPAFEVKDRAEKPEQFLSPESEKSSGESKSKPETVAASFNKENTEKGIKKDQGDKSDREEKVANFQLEEEEEEVRFFGKKVEEREDIRKTKKKEENLEKQKEHVAEFTEEKKQSEKSGQEKIKLETAVLEEEREEKTKPQKAVLEEEREEKTKPQKAVLEEEREEKTKQQKPVLEEEREEKTKPQKAVLEEEREEKTKPHKAVLEEEREEKTKPHKVVLEEEREEKTKPQKAVLEEEREEKTKPQKAVLEEEREEKTKQQKAVLEEEREEKTKPQKAVLEEEREEKTKPHKAVLEEEREEKTKPHKVVLEEEREEKTKPHKVVLEEEREETTKQQKAVLEELREDKEKVTPRVSAPRIVAKMDDCVTELGDLARFDCRVSAYPDPEITWYKDGNKVVPSAKHELLNFHDDIFSLLIKKVDQGDSGRYTCVAKNEYGEAKSQALLNVMALKEKITDAHVAPSFVTKFYDMEAIEGVPIEFVCVIDGNPDPSVTWLLNGQEVQDSSEILTRRQDDTVMLAFRSIKVEHSGEVICKLKNDSGQAMCKARLKVNEDLSKRGERPLFLEQPSDKEVMEGDEVTFECVISGRPDPEVTWYFNGRELYDSRRRSMRSKPGQKYMLTIHEVIPEHAGVYTCKAVNRAGDASCAVELSVKELATDQSLKGKFYDGGLAFDAAKYAFPPSFTRRIQDQRSLPGRMARFEAMVIGVPEPQVEWQKDGIPLKWGSKYKMGLEGSTAILVVDNCDIMDEGNYTCTLFNDAGKASCSAKLKVQEDKLRQSLPRFMSPARGVDLFRISSTPATKKPITREIPLEDKVPTIPIDKPVLLDVKPTSVKLSWMPAPTAMLPENAQRITYTIEACQLPSKQWVRLESNIDATTHYVYGLKPDTEYMFRVKADNRFGTSDPTLPCTLKPREEPKTRESMFRESEMPVRPVLPKARPYVSDIGKETVQIGWKPAEIPDYYGRSMSVPPVTYRVEAQKLPSEEWVPLASRVKKPSIYLSDLEPDRDYNIRVRAQTPYGVSQPTEPVWIPRAKAFTGVPVSRPVITEIEEGTARLQWSRVDIPAFDSMDEPLLYMIEMQEPPSYRWRELARRVPINSYIVRDLEPAQDYRFRVRAESRDGLLSEPSPATSLFRTLALSHTPVDRLEVEEYDPVLQSARLSWRRVEVPPYGDQDSPLLYMIEYETPGMDGWRPLASGIPTTRYRVPDVSPTEDYRFRVRALSPYGISPPSYPTSLYRRPSPMRPLAQDLHISSLEPESVGLSWRSASVPPYKTGEPVSYQIEAMEYPKQEWRPLATNIRDTSYHLGGLKPSSDYSFRVRAQTPSGLAEPTPPVTLTSLHVRPRLPVREPSVTELGSDSARLQWKPAELPFYSRHITPITYTVDYQEVPGRDWVVAARNIPDTSYTFRGLRGDRDYRFRVCPVTEYGLGEYSLPAHIHRRTAPSLPTREPMLSNISPTSATLSWHPASLASGSPSRPITYRVEGRDLPSSTWYDVASRLPSPSYNMQFLYPDQDYMFRVLADYDGVESEPTMAVYLPHRAGPPKMPRDAPFLSNVQPESVILAWRSVELPSRITDYSPVTYRIEIQEGPTSDWRPWARQINQTHFHVTKLWPDIDYSFRIRAENEFGISEPTDSILVRKRAVAPFMSQHEPLISDVRPESLRLTWQPAEMPSYLTDSVPVTYTVFAQEDGDHSWQPIARRIAGTSYYVTGLSPDRDYSFRIQAENNFGTSLQSFPSRLHRKLKAPIYSPEIEDVDSTSLRLSWKQPALSKPTTYSVETLEPSTWKWRPLVSRLPHPSYRVTGIQPTTDYAFRVRAEVDSVISDPSLPISFSRRRAGERAFSEQPSSRTALPTVPVERPTLSEVYDDSVRVNWHPTFYQSSVRKHIPQIYRLEVRELPDTNWHTLVPRTDAWSYEVTDLKPNQDYAFRVRTVTDTGMSEPSLPIFHYRQAATPRVPLPSPEVSDIGDDYIGLHWKLVDIPAFDVDETPLSFMIEAQRVPEYDWRPVARGVTGLSHKVTGLEPRHDYMFRLRGETPIGLTQPSASIPVYRRPVTTGVPITNLRIDPDVSQPYSARLRWNPVYMPPYGANTSFTYTLEVQEPPRADWYPLARDIYATSYTVPDLSPLKDYLFRVKARLPGGEYSSPTPSVPYYRSPATTWDRVIPHVAPYIDDYAPIARPYIEGLILKVPPRMSIEKPDMTVVSPECVHLSWKAARVPSATSSLSPTTYRVEVRNEDSFEWNEKATGIKGLNTEIKGLNPYIDYAFRVRAVNDFGWSESTLPTFLHRPQDMRDAAAEMEFEQFETYGSSLSDISVPRMPMDTPRILLMDKSMSLSWTPARIPAYARKTPITYVVEKKEPVDRDWVPLASRIPDTSYTIRSIEPKQDYLFRIRAENEHGLSEATLPAVLTRSKAPQFIRSSTSRERELDSPSRRSSYSYIDSISAGVPPRVPAGRPSISNVSETSLLLSWQPGRMPSYIKGPVKISYIVEFRQPPNHMWTKVSESVPGVNYHVTGLKPDQDYMFRVRAYNDSGMSEPTLPVSLNRDRAPVAEPRTLRKRSSVERFSSIERRTSMERSMSMDRGSSVPRFLSREGSRRDDDDIVVGKTPDTTLSVPEFVLAGSPGVQYAIDAQPAKLSVQICGFPLPTVDWYFKGKKLLYGDKYDGYVTPAGLAVLHFGPMTWDDVGEYKCVAENEQGESSFVVRLQISDPPTFLLPIRDLQIKPQGSGHFTCRVDGIPAPTVKFMKDWKPLAETSRFKVTQDALDQWSLHIEQATPSAAGCYICVAENAAGKVFSLARLSVDDDIPAVDDIYYKKSNFEDDYYVLEELGRGRYSTVRRVIQRSTGKDYAAKFTKVRDEADKDFFRLELDALINQKGPNVQKLYDAYESPQQLILVVGLADAGDVLDRATSRDDWTECRAAQLIKLILQALRGVHTSGFLHLDLKPTNIRFSSLEDSSLQLIDFGFARKLPLSNDLIFNYGTPEFCSPESVSNQAVSPASDLWAVGVLTHLLLTGVSPFYADTTPEILSLTRDCQWNPDDPHLTRLTDAARDFISRLLTREPRDRLSLEACLTHDWLKLAEKTGLPSLDVSPLKALQARLKTQQKASAVKTVANLVSLKRLLEGTDIRGLQPTTDPQTGEVILPDTEEYGQFLDEESWYEWQARHQQGLKSDQPLTKSQVKGHRLSVDALAVDVDDELSSSDKTPGKQLSGLSQGDIPPSIEKELEWMDEARKQRKPHEPDEISLASKRSSVASISTEGFPGPLFKEKLHDLAFSEGDTVILRCVIAGPPTPTVVWYKNEELLAEGGRLKMSLEEDGEATMTIRNAKSYDAGIYKCVGRNKFGRVSNRMRLLQGDVPGRPGQPAVAQISSTDALVLWEAPRSDGNSGVLFYKLDYKSPGQDRWLTATYTTQEAAVVTGLTPNTTYRFRVSATNRFGTSHYSWASVETRTKPEGSSHIVSDNFFDVVQLKSSQTSSQPTVPTDIDDIIPEGEATLRESEPKLVSAPLESVFNIGDSLYKGRFYEEKTLTLPSDNDKKFILRTVPSASGLREFDILKSLRHEYLLRLYDSYSTPDYIYLILEYAEGEHVARHLSHRRKYTENTVASVIRQVLYALEFLQRFNLVHLNLQPASIIVSKLEGCQVKLTDFSLARKVSGPEGDIVPRCGFADFIPPEVVVRDLAGFSADVWGIGTLAFLLLSGVSPFHGDSYESTLVNIALNRYDAIDLYENITIEALKFLFKVLKRLPRNRPSVQECLDNKWLQLTDQTVKEREDAIFLSNTLATFVSDYDKVRQSDLFRQSFDEDLLPIQMAGESKTNW